MLHNDISGILNSFNHKSDLHVKYKIIVVTVIVLILSA